MKKLNLLALDDDPMVLESLKLMVPEEWNLLLCSKSKEIPQEVEFHAAIIDQHLTGQLDRFEGLRAIEKLSKENPQTEIIAISGDLSPELMERALRSGATRFLSKPLRCEEVQITLDKIHALYLLKEANHRTHKNLFHWVGKSYVSEIIKRKIAFLKKEAGPILIEGESGTGKEVAAQLLHEQEGGIRPFIAVNIAAIPENLFESELFGHIRGAFTGADNSKMGLIEAAHGGDLFLDEVEALSLPLQVKLLRFLETMEIRRVGAKDSIKVQVRVIVATNRNLKEMVKLKEFREDLYWRLSGKSINLPPLRERGEDIEDLSNWFLSKDPYRKKELTEEALKAMKAYSWPGNVRELKRVCEYLCANAPLPILRESDVKVLLEPQAKRTLSSEPIDLTKGLTQLTTDFEAHIIRQALQREKDIDEASRLLQTSRSNLYKKIKDLNIEWKR